MKLDNDKCPICLKKPLQEIWPYCSAVCLHADPASAKDPDMQRRMQAFRERTLGAGGPGGMTPTHIDDKLSWYLSGAQDEAAHRQGINWGEKKILAAVADDESWICENLDTAKERELFDRDEVKRAMQAVRQQILERAHHLIAELEARRVLKPGEESIEAGEHREKKR